MTKWHLFLECKNGSAYKNLVFNQVIISIDAKKTFEKIQHPFMIKALNKPGIDRNDLNIIKAIYEKPTAILNGERQKAFPLRSGTKQGYLLSLLLFSFVPEVHTRAMSQEIKAIQIVKEEIIFSLDDLVICI